MDDSNAFTKTSMQCKYTHEHTYTHTHIQRERERERERRMTEHPPYSMHTSRIQDEKRKRGNVVLLCLSLIIVIIIPLSSQ
jgi:hypothetical protein